MNIRKLLLHLPLVSSLYAQMGFAEPAGLSFIITGPPASGKSTVIRALEYRGQAVVFEAAHDVFELQKVLTGDPEPWNRPDSQAQVTSLQLVRESLVPNNTTAFLDRSVIDGIAFMLLRDYSNSSLAQELIAKANVRRYNRRVFLMKSINKIAGAGELEGVVESSDAIEVALRHVYESLGFEVIEVPKMPVMERVDFILSASKEASEPLDHGRIRQSLAARDYKSWSCERGFGSKIEPVGAD